MVLDRLPNSTVVHLFRSKTHLLSLDLAHDEDDHDRNAKCKQDNAESTESPAEVDIDVKQLGNLGTSKRRRDGGGIVETHDDQSVTQGGGVGNNHVDNIDETKMADPVQRVSGGVHFHVLAGGLHDHADNNEENHGAKAPDTTPDVDDLCDGKGADTTEDGGDDARGRDEAVLGESGCYVGDEVGLDGLKETVDKGDKPDTRQVSRYFPS